MIERWEADSRPRVSPSFDEAKERRDQAFAGLHLLLFGPENDGQSHPIEPTPTQREEQQRIMQEIDRHGETMLNLVLELALLIDEAGQWHGPPLEKLLKDGDAASRQWRNLIALVQKSLAEPEL